ncbi:SH3-domain-containing protein [Aaosphaeria arxii CBS 175.79]|uniref:SH3-domain-containing protein n=1 Tax=Aaosphaeria arxii CBS 175.79 TaxID=1450172 RepID=A0A6A5Y935_9PLEO|nr:SH3-domain-containing protein [Aaosphaeria arxii CBS 175.79]KAF2021261.1 SH3-domain-containing protein [Aaosphaeria arxii CBS 175.79]
MANHPIIRPSATSPVRVKVIYDFIPEQDSELALKVGDVLEVQEINEAGWMLGRHVGGWKRGWFPVTYTEDLGDEGNDVVVEWRVSVG